MPASRTRYTFDAYHGGSWHARHLLWISEGGTGWLIPDGGDAQAREKATSFANRVPVRC